MSGTRLTHNMILKHGWSLVNIMAIIGQHYFKVEFLNLGSMGTVGGNDDVLILSLDLRRHHAFCPSYTANTFMIRTGHVYSVHSKKMRYQSRPVLHPQLGGNPSQASLDRVNFTQSANGRMRKTCCMLFSFSF